MNIAHNLICSSDRWARRVERELVPWGLEGVQLGDDVLEIGPGFGATTKLLAQRVPRLTVLELNERYCERLRHSLGNIVQVVQGDATQVPFAQGRFSAVVCFTMLHHIDPASLQDRVFEQVARVLEGGGTFAGTDSVGSGRLFKLIHIGDTLVPIDPGRLPARLIDAGLSRPSVDCSEGSFRFRAYKAA